MSAFLFYPQATLDAYNIHFEDITASLKKELATDTTGKLANERGRDAFVKEFFQPQRGAVGGLYTKEEIATLATLDLIVAAYVAGFEEGEDIPN